MEKFDTLSKAKKSTEAAEEAFRAAVDSFNADMDAKIAVIDKKKKEIQAELDQARAGKEAATKEIAQKTIAGESTEAAEEALTAAEKKEQSAALRLRSFDGYKAEADKDLLDAAVETYAALREAKDQERLALINDMNAYTSEIEALEKELATLKRVFDLQTSGVYSKRGGQCEALIVEAYKRATAEDLEDVCYVSGFTTQRIKAEEKEALADYILKKHYEGRD